VIAKRFGLEVAGLDYTEIGCETAREWLKRGGVNGAIYQRDLFAANADLHGQFDVVASFGVVEHFDNPAEPLGLMRKFLKPGGLLVTTVPNVSPGSLMARVQRVIGPRTLATHKLMSLAELRQFHERAGFKTVHCDYAGMGVTLICDVDNVRNRCVRAVTYRTVQIVRRVCELLGSDFPWRRVTALMMVYVGRA